MRVDGLKRAYNITDFSAAENQTKFENEVQGYKEAQNGKTYNNLMHYVNKGRVMLFFVENGEILMMYDTLKNRAESFDMTAFTQRNGPIQAIQRYNSYILIQFKHVIELFDFEKKSIFNVLSRISMAQEILDAQPDTTVSRFLYVQSERQIYLYDCDTMHN